MIQRIFKTKNQALRRYFAKARFTDISAKIFDSSVAYNYYCAPCDLWYLIMLPKMIDPRRSADQNIEYRGLLKADLLPRLVEAVERTDEQVSIDIRLFKDEQRRIRIQGSAAVGVDLICQRCIQNSAHQVDASVDLIVVYSEDQAKALPKELDAWVTGESANLHELLEDELLLALPIVAYHEQGCEAPEGYSYQDVIEREKAENGEKQSPFAVLKDLTHKI